MITSGVGPHAVTSSGTLRLSAQVAGLGPDFKLLLSMHNTGTTTLVDIPVTLGYSSDLYAVSQPLTFLPIFIPGVMYSWSVNVRCIDPNGAAAPIKVYVCSQNSSVPIVSAIVNMPICEVLPS
jgi:hypothetical protein